MANISVALMLMSQIEISAGPNKLCENLGRSNLGFMPSNLTKGKNSLIILKWNILHRMIPASKLLKIASPKFEERQTSYPAEMQNMWMRHHVADTHAVLLFSTETNGIN